MQKLLTACVFLILSAVAHINAEQQKAVLTTPEARPAKSEVEIMWVAVGRLPQWRLTIAYIDNTGTPALDEHNGVFVAPTADDPATLNVNEASPGNPTGADIYVKALNKANNSTKPLECRALEHLRDVHQLLQFTSCTGSPQ